MHGPGRSHDAPAIRFPDGLVTKAHAQCRNAVAEGADNLDGDACLRRGAWSGRQYDRGRRHSADLVDSDCIVAMHDDLRAKLAEVLHEVVRERIVVVDDEEHRRESGGGRWLTPWMITLVHLPQI